MDEEEMDEKALFIDEALGEVRREVWEGGVLPILCMPPLLSLESY